MKEKIRIIVSVVVLCLILTGCGAVGLNKTADIKTDKIKLTVLGSEQVTVDEGELYLGNGEYIKVKVTIENYDNETYRWNPANIYLGEEMASLKTLAQSDILKADIAPNETATGYIYFPVTDATELTYISNFDATGHGEKEIFKIK